MKAIAFGVLILLISAQACGAGYGYRSIFYEGFEGVAPPGPPPGWVTVNANGDLGIWETKAYGGVKWGHRCIRYVKDVVGPADDWFFTSGLALAPGGQYTLEFMYRASSAIYPEAMSVWAGTSQDPLSMSIPIWNSPAITDTEFVKASTPFGVPAPGTYYFGFHAQSPPGMKRLYVDDVNLLEPEYDLDLRIGMTRELYEDGTPTYSPGDTVECIVYVKNVGASTPTINKRFFIGTGIRDTELEFDITDPLGQPLNIIVVYAEGSPPEARDFSPLAPDSIAVKWTDLWEWFSLDALGDYSIQAHYHNYSDPGGVGAWMGDLYSDPILIRIQ